METQSSLLCSQIPATGLYPEPAVPIFSPISCFSQTHCKINLHPNLLSQELFSHRI